MWNPFFDFLNLGLVMRFLWVKGYFQRWHKMSQGKDCTLEISLAALGNPVTTEWIHVHMLTDERHVACKQAQVGLLGDDSQFISITPDDIVPTAWGHPRPSETAQIRKTVQLIHYFKWNNKIIVAWNHYFLRTYYFLNFISITVYIQYCFVLGSGVQHSG